MKTAIVMVTYNGWPITENCLADLAALPQDDFVIAVADNASTDGTVENIRSQFPHVKVYPLSENIGFGRANNAAVEGLKNDGIKFDALCLLNNDTRLDPATIVELRKSLTEAQSRFGDVIVVPTVRNSDGSPQHNYFAKINPLQFFLNAFRLESRAAKHLEGVPKLCPDTTFYKTYWASAVCWMMPANLFGMLAGFDEKIFMYYEDWDFARRAIDIGYGFYIQSKCSIIHLGGGSARSSLSRALQHDRSQEYVFGKHMGKKGVVLSRSFRACRSLARLLPVCAFALFNRKYAEYAKNHLTLLREAL
jgi:N-acetylglucosaminyl-diphospho-decaprenol L-rhamnosyltransferase